MKKPPAEDEVRSRLRQVTYYAERWQEAKVNRDADGLRVVASSYRKAEDEFVEWVTLTAYNNQR